MFRQKSSFPSALALCVACSVTVAPVRFAHAAPPDDDGAAPELSKGEQLLTEGHEAFGKGDYETAITKYEGALAEGAMAKEALAQAHFRQGTTKYQAGEYQSALEHFQDAQALFPSPQFFYNIAQCYEMLENYENAVTNYKAYLRGSPNAKDRLNTENKIERLQKSIELGEEAEKPDPEPPRPMEEEEPPPPGRPLVITGAVLTAVGAGVAIGGGAGFGVVAADKSSQVDDVYNAGNPKGLTLAETRTLDEEGKQAQTLQLVMIGVGAAVGVTGIALLAVGLAKNKKAAGKTALLPSVGPQGGGLTLVGRF